MTMQIWSSLLTNSKTFLLFKTGITIVKFDKTILQEVKQGHLLLNIAHYVWIFGCIVCTKYVFSTFNIIYKYIIEK